MSNKTFINEVRQRVSMLESKYEAIARDLESARGFLAILERETVAIPRSQRHPTHADLVGDAIFDILSQHTDMHRMDVLQTILKRGVHIGYDGNPQKQLAGLSSISK